MMRRHYAYFLIITTLMVDIIWANGSNHEVWIPVLKYFSLPAQHFHKYKIYKNQVFPINMLIFMLLAQHIKFWYADLIEMRWTCIDHYSHWLISRAEVRVTQSHSFGIQSPELTWFCSRRICGLVHEYLNGNYLCFSLPWWQIWFHWLKYWWLVA